MNIRSIVSRQAFAASPDFARTTSTKSVTPALRRFSLMIVKVSTDSESFQLVAECGSIANSFPPPLRCSASPTAQADLPRAEPISTQILGFSERVKPYSNQDESPSPDR